MRKPTPPGQTPLLKKLGIKADSLICILNKPENYAELLPELNEFAVVQDKMGENLDMIHYFETQAEILDQTLPSLKAAIKLNGVIWISWYKKSAKMPTDITEDTIRAIALPMGLVDIKVCAIDEKWSGLKLVIPLKERPRN